MSTISDELTLSCFEPGWLSAHEPGVFHSSFSECLFFICTGERLSSASLGWIVRLEMPLLFLAISSASGHYPTAAGPTHLP